MVPNRSLSPNQSRSVCVYLPSYCASHAYRTSKYWSQVRERGGRPRRERGGRPTEERGGRPRRDKEGRPRVMQDCWQEVLVGKHEKEALLKGLGEIAAEQRRKA